MDLACYVLTQIFRSSLDSETQECLLHICCRAMSMQFGSHSLVFSTYGDLGYVQVLCLVTQQRHIKRRQTGQIRREERLSDSCLPGWVTLLRDPLRGAQPWVTSVPQSGRKDFKHKACTTSTPLAAPSPPAVLLSSTGDL